MTQDQLPVLVVGGGPVGLVPGAGTRYYDRKGRPQFYARGPHPYRHGYPFKNQFAQPELERLLLDALKSRTHADVRFSTELVAVRDPGTNRMTARVGSAAARLRTVGTAVAVGADVLRYRPVPD